MIHGLYMLAILLFVANMCLQDVEDSQYRNDWKTIIMSILAGVLYLIIMTKCRRLCLDLVISLVFFLEILFQSIPASLPSKILFQSFVIVFLLALVLLWCVYSQYYGNSISIGFHVSVSSQSLCWVCCHFSSTMTSRNYSWQKIV